MKHIDRRERLNIIRSTQHNTTQLDNIFSDSKLQAGKFRTDTGFPRLFLFLQFFYHASSGFHTAGRYCATGRISIFLRGG